MYGKARFWESSKCLLIGFVVVVVRPSSMCPLKMPATMPITRTRRNVTTGSVASMDQAFRMAQTVRVAAWLPYDNPAVGIALGSKPNQRRHPLARLSCEKAGKTRIFTAVQEPSGESRLSGVESTMSTTPPFEIPTDMRKMTEQSMEQVRTAINSYLQFFQRAVPGNVMGGSELSNKILGYAERDVATAFEFAQRLVQVRDFQGLVRLQMEIIQAQMQAMTEQAKDLTETATKAVMDSAKTPTKGGLSSESPATSTATIQLGRLLSRATKRNRPLKTAGMTGYVCTPHLLQVFHPGGREGDGLLVVSVVDPEATVLRLHVGGHVPQQRLVLAEDFGGAADGDCVGWRRHGQAARATGIAWRDVPPSNVPNSACLAAAFSIEAEGQGRPDVCG